MTGYRVERCAGAGCATFAQIATPTGTSFSDTGLTASTSYSYRVRAVDAAGNLGAFSNIGQPRRRRAGHDAAEGAPGLTATRVSRDADQSELGPATDNVGVTGYRVERCAGAGCTTFAQIATPTGTSFSDTGLTASTSYSYRVRPSMRPATRRVLATEHRDEAAPDTTPPRAPGALTASGPSPTQIDLSWGAATDNVGVTGYRVERCAGAGCTQLHADRDPGRHELQRHGARRLDVV